MATDRLGHVEPVEKIIEAPRPEHDLDRARRVTVDVEGAQPLRDVQLGDAEARLGGDEVPAVDVEVDVDLVELDVREVVGLDRVPELGVHLLDLGDDRAGLVALRADGRIGRRRPGTHEQGRHETRECDDESECLSLRRVGQTAGLPASDEDAAGGVAGHKSGSLAAVSDDCTVMCGQKLCKHEESCATVVRPVEPAREIPRAVRRGAHARIVVQGSTHRHDHRLPLDAVRLRHVLIAMCALAIAAATASSPLAASGDLTSRLAKALRSPHVSLERTSAIAIDARTGTIVYAHNETLPVVPASNEKLPVSWAALSRLGPGYRFATELYGTGSRSGSRLAREPVSQGPR